MGIERSVTLWYLHRQMLLQELASLEDQLVQAHTVLYPEGAQPEVRKEAAEEEPCTPLADIENQYKRIQERLHNQGPCPKPMMG